MEKNRIELSFNIWNFEDITHDEISSLLDIQPFKIYKLGERRNPKNPDSPLWKKNGWLLRSSCAPYSSFEQQLEDIITVLQSKRNILEIFSKKYLCEFSCAVFIYYENEESRPSIHLGKRYNNFIAGLEIEFDLDLYIFSAEK